jgi:glycosyltransferase involved in cell wall biosynthesis
MFAVVKTWMDEDVIEATVRNALAQGAEAVYVVDNGSSDATVRCAEAAGATVVEVHESDVFDGRLSQALMNAVVARQSLECGAEHVWWLYLDSDEFPEGPGGLTLREYLATLDRRFRMVGAAYVNHLPQGKPEYLPGYHPIDFQPLCYEFAPARWPPCGLGHWKHPLQRFDRREHFILANDGAHSAFCLGPLIEPDGGIVTHHFQFREEVRTRRKIELSCGPGSERTALHESLGFDGFVRRRMSLDAVYSGRWADMETLPNADPTAAAHPKPWPDLATVRRWYPLGAVEAARSHWSEPPAMEKASAR